MTPIVLTESDGGVEEQKEEEPLSPTAWDFSHHYQHRRSSIPRGGVHADPFDEQKDGFQAQVENLAKSVLGSCGQVLSCLVPTGDNNQCSWPPRKGTNPRNAAPPQVPIPAPLSIAEDLRKLATKEGRVFGGGMRRADIPRFLGEEAVYSFDDDNISAISQHTLEEMARHGIRYPIRRRPSSESIASSKNSDSPPPRITACSTTTASSRERRKQRLTAEHRKEFFRTVSPDHASKDLMHYEV